jgi:hypothetical protein
MPSNISVEEKNKSGVSETALSFRTQDDFSLPVFDALPPPEREMEATRHRRAKKKAKNGNMGGGMNSSKGKMDKSPKKSSKTMMSPKGRQPNIPPPTPNVGVDGDDNVVQAIFGIRCGGGRASRRRKKRNPQQAPSSQLRRRQLRSQILYCTFEDLDTGISLDAQFQDLRCPAVASIAAPSGSRVVVVETTNLSKNPQCHDRHLKNKSRSRSQRNKRPQRSPGKGGKSGKGSPKRKDHPQQEDIEPTPLAAICPTQGLLVEPLGDEEFILRRNLQNDRTNIFHEDGLECLALAFSPDVDIADLGITGLTNRNRAMVRVSAWHCVPSSLWQGIV